MLINIALILLNIAVILNCLTIIKLKKELANMERNRSNK